MKEVLIYQDNGVSEKSFSYIKNIFSSICTTKSINSESVQLGNWIENCQLFIVPGGRDLPYKNSLKGKGIENIITFVKEGGNYLGICAGAYFASSYIEFAKGTSLEVAEERDLKFFSGKAIGPVLGKSFSYEDGTGIYTPISYQSENLSVTIPLYYHGGCTFLGKGNLTKIGFYNDLEKALPAIVRGKFMKGKVLLSGVHFEYQLPNKQEEALRKKLINDILSFFTL